MAAYTPTIFTDLKGGGRSVRPSYYFMMKSLLHSRIDTGFLSNQEGEDEDVNVYLAHLLHGLAAPEFLTRSRDLVAKYDHEVFERADRSDDSRFKYELYKANADFLLASVGVFENRSQALLNPRPGNPARSRHPEFELGPEEMIHRGRAYYRFAHGYSLIVNADNPGMSEVLLKLSERFPRYVELLNYTCREYLELVHSLTPGEMYHLERFVNAEQEADHLRQAQDAFLDAYTEWKGDPGDATRGRLDRAIEEVRRWNPDFNFSPDQ